MGFKSLFVGIDRYASPLISDLSCSVRDAKALHGLFGDAFGASDSELLIDGKATLSAVIERLKSLQVCDSTDVVVVGFSGHGSDSHHLVTYDADPEHLDETALPLDALTDLFSKIPAQHVILLLDCCFAGGAGAKVFHAPIATKGPASPEALLQRVAGKGRVIFTAATADEEAIEDRRRGHGLFTFFLLEALRGAPEVVRAGRISLLLAFDFVVRSVVAAATAYRHKQQPALRGTIDGELLLPVLTPGPIFVGYFPNFAEASASERIDDLARFGFPEPLLVCLRSAIPGLNALQQEAINKMGLFRGEHLVVSAPTSSGKTMVGELAALQAYMRGERSYLLLPLRALVNEKYDDFVAKYGSFGLRVIRSTGEIADDNESLARGKFDIALLTYERFAAVTVMQPHLLRYAGLVVIDEVQMIADPNRGPTLEFLLTLLKSQRHLGVEPQMVALSAVVGDTNGLESWLGARLLRTTIRPVPLEEGLVSMDGSFRFIAADGSEKTQPSYTRPEFRKGTSQDIIVPLVRQLVSAGEKVIVFREIKSKVRATADYLRAALMLPPAMDALKRLPSGDPSAASAQLRRCLEGGVAFHNADLDREERTAIEASFRDPESPLRVLVATTTVAMGVNTPASSVVIAGLEHPDHPYSVAEYKNMAGRAGRLGFAESGKSFLVAPSSAEAYQLWNRYVLGKPEAVRSCFETQDPLSLVCRVLATAGASKTVGMSLQDLIDFIQSSLAAYQGNPVPNAGGIAAIVERLRGAALLEQLEDRYRLTELGKVAGELGIEVESVVRVGRALRGLPSGVLVDRVLLAAVQLTMELDEILMPVHKKSIKERERWARALQEQYLPSSVVSEMRAVDGPTMTARAKRYAAILMWLEGHDLRHIEASLLQHLPGENAAGPIRSTAERTRDLLGAVAAIGRILATDHQPPASDLDLLARRLELGIPADMAWMLKHASRSLERGDYLSLRRTGLRSLDTLSSVSDERLVEVLGDTGKVRRVRAVLATVNNDQNAEIDSRLPMPTPAKPSEGTQS